MRERIYWRLDPETHAVTPIEGGLDGHLAYLDEMREMRARNSDGDDAWRRVGKDEVNNVVVSTVFLRGIDHSYGSGPPLLFETMVFPENSLNELYCQRYSTWEEAERGHQLVVLDAQLGVFDDYGGDD